MEQNDILQDVIQAFREQSRLADSINKKILTALIVLIIAFAITIISITYLYFRTDYDYSTVTQNQSQTTTVDGSDQ